MSAATLAAEPTEVPVLVLAVLACILAGFATTSLAGINPGAGGNGRSGGSR